MENGKSMGWMIEESINGGTAAFKLLFDHLSDDLFRFVRLRVGVREDAIDILQEVFVDLWQALSSSKFTYSTDGEFRSFLYLIARRRISKLYRFRKLVMSLDDMEDVEDNGTTGVQSGEKAHLIQTINKLESEDQEVIKLKYYSGLTFPEIARLLDKEESAVRVRHHRALSKLRNILGYEKEQ